MLTRLQDARSLTRSRLPQQLHSRTTMNYRASHRIRQKLLTRREIEERNFHNIKNGFKRRVVGSRRVKETPLVIFSSTGLAVGKLQKSLAGYRPRLDYLTRRANQKVKALQARRVVSVTRRKSPYIALKVLFVTLASLNRRFDTKFQKRRTVRAVRKLRVQQHLRTGIVSFATSSKKAFVVGRKPPMRAAVATKLLRNSVLKTAPFALSQHKTSLPSVFSEAPAALSRYLPAAQASVDAFPQPNFLKKVIKQTPNAQARETLNSRSTLLRHQRRYQELRFYHHRPRTRLPGLAVSRSRRRKGGLVTFARNTLKRPRTLSGWENLLLPPVDANATFNANYSVKKQMGLGVLSASQQHEDA